MDKKYFLVSMLLMSNWYGIFSMERSSCQVYFHGYGEPVLDNEQNYKVKFEEDATQEGLGPDTTKSSFYTGKNVIAGLLFLKNKVVEEQYDALDIIARSNGGGVFINCLYFLHHYNQHKDYFADSGITQEDAQKIINAINAGSIIITVPFLSLYNALIVQRLSTIGGYMTATLCTYYGYKKYGYRFNSIWLLLIFYILRQSSTAVSQTSSDEVIVPKITHYSYDPHHIKPIKAVEYLKYKIKCPVLLHICKNDGVLKGPNQDTVTVFENIRKGNEALTYIILTDDDSHNKKGDTFTNAKIAFKKNNEQELARLGAIKNVDCLKKEIGWPVLGVAEMTYQKPTLLTAKKPA